MHHLLIETGFKRESWGKSMLVLQNYLEALIDDDRELTNWLPAGRKTKVIARGRTEFTSLPQALGDDYIRL
jgi:hypothetical protein